MNKRLSLTHGLFAMLLASFSALPAADFARAADPADKLLVYFGTYTKGASKGIYVSRLDLASGALEPATLAAEAKNPSFLAFHPNGKFLYANGELDTSASKKGQGLIAFAMDPKDGKLTALNCQSSGGVGACHVAIDPTGKWIFAANYSSGSVPSVAIGADGRLGEIACVIQHEGSSVNPQRQKGPHAHGITLDAAGRLVFVTDLGLDKIMIYRLDAASGKLTANDPPSVSTPPGAGPRHFAFHPNGRYGYVINELDSTMTAMSYDSARGELRVLETLSTLPAGFQGKNTCAEVVVHPSGKYVYGSNRGHDSIAIFAVDESTGKLRPVGHELTRGKEPRNFAVDPSGKYLLAANQNSDTVVVFRIDATTGQLHATGSVQNVPSPVCIVMMPFAG